ncbi:MAG: LegC family aminotransferase [Pseudomonadota bacterium]
MSFDPRLFITTLKNCLPSAQASIALHEPLFAGNEWRYVKECLDTGWVSSGGKFVDRFEYDLAAYTGAKHCVVAVNGTAALHIIFLLAGIKPNDEVLVPALTFIATCNAIAYCGGVSHFIDSEESHLGIDFKKLERYLSDITEIKDNVCYNKLTKRPIRALCVMHTFGHPVDLDAAMALCDRYHLKLIEDAAEALGSFYKGQHVGHHGFAGALSFNGNKIITTGGGGAIVTDDESVAKKAKHITTTAKLPHHWKYDYDCIGYNYRLPNINAALGCAQLEKLPEFLQKKRQLTERYEKTFKHYDGCRFIEEPKEAKSNCWLNAILLDNSSQHLRNDILELAIKNNIFLRPVWELMDTLPMYQHCPRMDLSGAKSIAARLINIPSSVCLSEEPACEKY